MNFKLNQEQVDFIVNHMDLCINHCLSNINKYGYNDEATAGADDAIKLAKEIKDILERS
ncbi:MAG: hypothetical protein ACOCRK_03505 [bacterium]